MKHLIKKIINYVFPNRVYLIRNGLAKGLHGTGGFGFIPRIKKTATEFKFLKSLTLTNKIIYDIGSNIGMHTLFFAKSVQPNGNVFSFEPNPYVYKQLLRNIEVNNFSNIQTFKLAVGNSEYRNQLIFNPTHQETGSLNSKIQTDLIANSVIERVEVEVISLDYFIQKNFMPLPELIKIDVEGFEFDVLMGMINILKNNKPDLIIEIHGTTIEEKEANVSKIIKLLTKYNYNIILVETNETITIENAIKAREGHLYCS